MLERNKGSNHDYSGFDSGWLRHEGMLECHDCSYAVSVTSDCQLATWLGLGIRVEW